MHGYRWRFRPHETVSAFGSSCLSFLAGPSREGGAELVGGVVCARAGQVSVAHGESRLIYMFERPLYNVVTLGDVQVQHLIFIPLKRF